MKRFALLTRSRLTISRRHIATNSITTKCEQSKRSIASATSSSNSAVSFPHLANMASYEDFFAKSAPPSLKEILPAILAAAPAEWRGTTFNNSVVRGREGFAEELTSLLQRTFLAGELITTQDLINIGNAEDYLRVASNMSTILEMTLASEDGLDVSQVYTFASKSFPILAVNLATRLPVHVYHGSLPAPFTSEELLALEVLGLNISCFAGSPPLRDSHSSHVVLGLKPALLGDFSFDGVVDGHTLYITNPEKVVPSEVLRVRKRMSGPVTTPVAEDMLRGLAHLPATTTLSVSNSDVQEFYASLQRLCGTAIDEATNPVLSTSGLASLSSLWASMVNQGGADVLMSSTSYGGSNELTNMWGRNSKLVKHAFDIQGNRDLLSSIQAKLDDFKNMDNMHQNIVVFIEIPTNPDMKVPDMEELARICSDHNEATGKNVVLVIDTTLAPGSGVMRKLETHSADLPVMCFISMSKSLSRGMTTAGALVANHTVQAKTILQGAHQAGKLLDTSAKEDQLFQLVNNHRGVLERCEQAYSIADAVGKRFQQDVLEVTGEDMSLAFVGPEEASNGFAAATFSFNLPAFPGASSASNEKLAQSFVDLLCFHEEFKPCVSFGQDNGLVYVTVPATSTQGAIKAEDKAKQAVGGVQLVRLSFPPNCNAEAVSRILSDATHLLYN